MVRSRDPAGNSEARSSARGPLPSPRGLCTLSGGGLAGIQSRKRGVAPIII